MFGDIISDQMAGLVGGLGMAPGANIGKDAAMFEPVHGSAPDIAGKNVANPTAMMLAAVLLLEHIDQRDVAARLRTALESVLWERRIQTPDLGGTASTDQFTDAVVKAIEA